MRIFLPARRQAAGEPDSIRTSTGVEFAAGSCPRLGQIPAISARQVRRAMASGLIVQLCHRRRDWGSVSAPLRWGIAMRMEQKMTIDVRATEAAEGRRGKR